MSVLKTLYGGWFAFSTHLKKQILRFIGWMFSRALRLRYTQYLFTPEGPILPWSITLKVPAAISSPTK